MKSYARPMREETKKEIFYQIFLRAFTDEGTIESARKMLPSIADLGVTVVYLCPINEADDDMDPAHWSDRQHASGFNNPKNPYRMKDYYKIDEEYGTDADLLRFVQDAHRLGMKVFLDLVYLHCGPRASFLSAHPDFIERDESGEPIYNRWHFPNLNFGNPALRAYLEENMVYFVEKFDIDGYRCDVGDQVPLDFWLKARKRLEAIKPQILMLNEGSHAAYLEEGFEWNYSFKLHRAFVSTFVDGASASAIREVLRFEQETYPEGYRMIRYIDNHDTASDSYSNRYEKSLGERGVECAFAMMYTLRGAPLLYNGNEACDDSRHSLWSNREHGKLHVRWENALTPAGVRRRDLLRSLAALFRAHPALYDGDLKLLDHDSPDAVLAYLRTAPSGERVAVILNTKREAVSVHALPVSEPIEVLRNGGGAFLYADGSLSAELLSFGYLILRLPDERNL
jgi:glycosidase